MDRTKILLSTFLSHLKALSSFNSNIEMQGLEVESYFYITYVTLIVLVSKTISILLFSKWKNQSNNAEIMNTYTTENTFVAVSLIPAMS